jgi:PAS domain S-box-containing protein
MRKFKKTILLYLAVSLLIVLGSFSILFFNFEKQVNMENEILKTEGNVMQVDSLTNNLLELESDKRAFQITSDTGYLKKYYYIKTICNESFKSLKSHCTNEIDLAKVEKAEVLMNLRLANMDSGLLLFKTAGPDAAIALMQNPHKKLIREQLTNELELLKKSFLNQFRDSTLSINRYNTINKAGLLVLLFVFITLMLSATFSFKRAQQRIIKNHFKFKEAQRIAKIGSWEWDFATNKLKWSQEQFKIFGEQRGEFELTFENYLRHFKKEDQDKIRKKMLQVFAGSTEFDFVHELIRKDGSTIMVHEQGTVLFNKQKKPIGLFGTTQNITERVNAEKELLRAQKEFKEIFDNSADGIYRSTKEGLFIMANRSMAGIFEYASPEELISSITDIGSQIYANPEDRKNMSELISTQGHVQNYELQVLTKTRKSIWVSANIRKGMDENNEFKYFEGTLEDISERKRWEQQLLNLSNRLQLAIKATNIGIWDWDVISENTVWDDEMFKIYNVDKSECKNITEAWESALHPDDLKRVREELQLALKGEKEFDTEFRVLWKDNSVHYIKGHALVQFDESGKALNMIGTNEDITQRKLDEEEILLLNRNLEQFANITAHDLQEPIRMVSGFLGLLDKKYSNLLDEQGRSYIHRAKDGADRMTILIRDLLEYSRSGNKAAKKEFVNLSSVVDLVQKDMSIVMDDTSADLFVQNNLPIVEGTQSALYRLFLNLVSNGIKFRKKGISPKVNIQLQEESDYWKFTVQDNGIGVAEQDQAKLFKAFQRLHRKEEYPGTGLGLVTCKKIVETHGGKIWMTSEYGKGTAFHFTLPKMRA